VDGTNRTGLLSKRLWVLGDPLGVISRQVTCTSSPLPHLSSRDERSLEETKSPNERGRVSRPKV